ncbi:hypothetical protein Bca52824_066665 [Brassica carinata]|uniref:Enhancer of mRNA-decapping protein 4 C-terminal domain-containing protein n=1 Tax=Brassica carinata TaxID=52824 RepID=A0A8X7QPI0_BRACI|nr:hypothetical protein Bca52824_066665 [Brassica carinata]
MASSPGNTNPNNPPPFDLGTLFKPSSSPFPTPPASYPPPAGPFLHNEAVTSSSSSPAANLHQQQRTLSYPTPPVNLQSPRANHNPGTHLLALLNNSNGAVAANQEPPSSHHQEIARSFPSGPIRVPSCKFPMGRFRDSREVEAPMDPTAQLSRLVSEGKYEESFTSALQRSDVSIVSWLCAQTTGYESLPLSQGVLLSLLQQLACDISKDTSRKLGWMTDVVTAINPSDQMIVVHARRIFEQVYQILHHQLNAPGSDVSAIRLIMHVLNSMLMGCK